MDAHISTQNQRHGVERRRGQRAALEDGRRECQQQEHQYTDQRQHMQRETRKRCTRKLPQKQVLRVANRRQGRARIDCQRFKNDQLGHRHPGDAAHA